MSTTFPGALDSYTLKVDNVDQVVASHVNNLQDAVIAIETLARQANNNLLYHTLTHNDWQEGVTISDPANDTYVANLWNLLWTNNAPDITGVAGGATDPFSLNFRCTLDTNSCQVGIVQFLTSADTIPLRGKTLSLSADLWGTNITSLRMAVLEWAGTADSVTSSVVAGWGAGNPALAANWTYIGTPAAITISSTRARKAVNGLAVGTSTNNLAVFIWTDAVEDSGDLFNVARAKLEIADQATDFVARDAATERRMIQRFFIRLANSGTIIASGVAISTSASRVLIPTPVTMRTNPTVVATAGDYSIRCNGASRTCTSIDSILVFDNGIRAAFNDSGAGLTASHAVGVYTTAGPLDLDARL